MDYGVKKESSDVREKREAMEKMKTLRHALGVSDTYEESFQRHLAEELSVPRAVIGKMMEMEELKALRKRAGILNQLDQCKARIVNALEMADVKSDDIPWGPNDDHAPEPNPGAPVAFTDPTHDKDQAKLTRRAEQSVILCAINQYIAGCSSKAEDMNELVEWMSNFVFEISWDEVGVQPIEDREDEEADAYRAMVLSLQRAWKCVRKMEQFIQLMVSDDTFDVLSGKFPPHVTAMRQRKNIPSRKLWCSNKWRQKIDQYTKLRTKLNSKKSKTNLDKKSITVLPGNDVPKDPYKEVEAIILNEVSNSWEEATADVMYHIQETCNHRFTKPSCKTRLDRAMLLLEFIQAATRGKLIVAENTRKLLKDTQATVARMQEEAAQMQKEMAESQKVIQAARRKITRLKRQLEAVNKENEKLLKKIATFHDQVSSLERKIEELQELPNQSEFDECKERLEELEEEFAELEEETEQLKSDLDAKTGECEAFRSKLSEEKEISSNLAEEVQAMEEENDKANARIKELEEKLSSQESNIMSLRLMVYYKDEVIRRLKQAAIELKSSERRTPKRPPTSPEEGAKRSSQNVREPKKEESKSVSNKELPEKVEPPKRDVVSEPKLGQKKSEIPPVTSDATSEVTDEVSSDAPQEGVEEQKDGSPVAEVEIPKSESVEPKSRLTQAKKPPPPKPETKVFFKPDERNELLEEKMRTQQEIAEAYSKLHQLNQQFQVKLKTAVDQEKHKSVLEKMKNEEELQNLCFSVRDETMKVQKEMKTFNDNISKQLELLIGFKGKLFDESSQAKSLKRRRRTTGGLLSVVNTENEGGVGVQKPVPPLAGGGMLNQGFMDPNMGMMGGMGGPMGGFGGEMMMMGPGMMGPGMMGPGMMGPGMMDPNMNNGENQNEDQEIGKGNVDYWKNLKSALGVKPPKKEEEPVPTETPKRNPLVARVLAEKQRRLSIVTNPAPDVSSGGAMGSLSSSSSGCSDGFRDYLDMVDPEMAELMRTLRPSAGTLSEEQKKENTSLESSNEMVQNHDNSQRSNDVGERKLPEKSEESHNESKKETSISIRVCEIKSDNCENAPPTVSESESVEVEKTEDGKMSGSPIVAITPAPELRDVLIVSGDDDESPPPRGPLLTVVDRRMARIGNRRRSSVIPFRNVMQIARRQSIRPPPPPKVVKFKGFYNEFGNPFRSKTELEKKRDALSREAAVRRRKEQLEEQERERRRARKKAIAATTGIDDDPVKQAEVFVRNISQQVNNFFSGMNDNLVDAIQRNNSKMESKVWIIENELQKVRMSAQAEIAAVKEERDKKASELNKTKRILMSVIGGAARTPSTVGSSSTVVSPYQIISRLKQAEAELDETQEKLNKATKKHESSAEEYRQKSFILEHQIQKSESSKLKAEQKMRQQKAEADFLKVQLHELKVGETQRLLLSLKDHRINFETITSCEEIEENMKNVALGLLHRSMLFPGVRFHQLVHRYRQHVRLQDCVDRIKSQLNQRVDARKLREGRIWDKQKQNERKMLRQLLSRLESRQKHVRDVWKQKREDTLGSRQKILMMITLLFHKIRNEKKDINLIQPIIYKVSGRERRHNNSPVAGFTQPCNDLRLVFPYSSYDGLSLRAAPNTPVSVPPEPLVQRPSTPEKNGDRIDVVGRNVLEEKSSGKRTEAQWYPEVSVFCPFSNRSGMVAPVNSHTNVNLSALKPYGNGVSLPRITPATRASIRRHKRPTSPLEMPRIVELEVQGGLRRAKSTIVEKLMAQPQNHYDVAQSYTSQIHLRDFEGENSDHCLPPIAPDIKRPSSIPSPQRLKSRASTKQSSKSKTTSKDRTLSPAKKNPQKPETSPESDTSVSPTSERSSSRHSAALPDIS